MVKKSSLSILFLGKKNDAYTKKAYSHLVKLFSEVEIFLGDWGDPLPKEIKKWRGDYIISYLSRWILPNSIMKESRKAAINFHPASPEYPGIGCNNFALYEESETYGVTCHHMTESVDSGDIIAVTRFAIKESDTVDSLLKRTYTHQFNLFKKIIDYIKEDQILPSSKEKWSRKPFMRSEFNQLSIITSLMSEDEVRKRIRATSYKGWQPYLKIGNFIFEYKEK